MASNESASPSVSATETKENSRLGQLARKDDRFCPYLAISKYPYQHLSQDPDCQKLVAQRYWDYGQFKRHGWNIFYIRMLSDDSRAPLLLIPKAEVQAFFRRIDIGTGHHMPFPRPDYHPGFEIEFSNDGEPRPRYLGRLTSDIELSELQNSIPKAGVAPEEPLSLNDCSFAAFEKKMESAYLAGRNDDRARKERKKRGRIDQKGQWCTQLKRTQCYLGLRPKAATAMPPSSLDFTKPALYAFNLDVVFICIDIEVHETNSKRLTEVGISTLDTADLVTQPPGHRGNIWISQMRCRHFRVADYAHIVNRRYVSGCPDKFMQKFGTSEWISVKEVPQVVAACLRPPYSEPGCYTPHPTKLEDCPRFISKSQRSTEPDGGPKRNVVLVGHDIRSDIGYLRSIGYDISNLGSILEAIDTIDLWRAWKHEPQATKLGNVLLELDVDCWHLHNAGNDAAYTLQALIGIAIAALEPVEEASTSAPINPLNEAALEAHQRLVEQEEEWAKADTEGGDGGEAVTISQAERDQLVAKARRVDERNAQRKENRSRPGRASNNIENPCEVNASPDVAGHILPHLRWVGQSGQSAKKQEQQPHASAPLSKQMQKRLVIMDDEDYAA